MYHAPQQANRLYIVQQSGTIRILQRGKLVGTPFLDVSDDTKSGGEQGLLGLAFHPGYARNGRFFVYYTNSSGDQQQVVEYRRGVNGRANPDSARVVLSMDDNMSNHNGGHLAFGPDGFLYIGTGDGGGGATPTTTPRTATRSSARSCASTSTRARRASSTASRRTTRSPPAAGRRRSTPTGCATPGASRSTAPAETSGSGTSVRTTSRRWTSACVGARGA